MVVNRTKVWSLGLRGGLVACCAFLIFVRLGHYPLWDDEAVAALLAGSVWRTGDSAVELPVPRDTAGEAGGVNVMGYAWGTQIVGRVDRAQPPAQLWLMAPFVGIMGNTSLAARLPMACVGVGVVALMVRAMSRFGATRRQWVIFAVLLVTCVPLWLYLRQARYYPLAILLVLLAGYWYWPLAGIVRKAGEGEAGRQVGAVREVGARELWKIGLCFGALPFVSSQAFVTFAPLFLIDYLLFGRRHARFSAGGWVALLAPSMAAVGAVLLSWNPFLIAPAESYVGAWSSRLVMIYRAFRDLNVGHIGTGALLLAAPLLGVLTRRPALLRGTVALVCMCIIDGIVDPMTPATSDFAEIRHLAPAIPITLAMSVVVIDVVWSWRRAMGIFVLLLTAFTNVLNWGALQPGVRLRSIQYEWTMELLSPPPDPYSAAIAWVRQNAPAGSTIGVDPDWMRYPLMYHLPEYLYTWQVVPRSRERNPWMDPRQVRGSSPPPDYLISFAYRPDEQLAEMNRVAGGLGQRYERVGESQTYWQDLFRPEITRRTFRGVEVTNRYYEGIYFYKLVSDPAAVPPR